MRYTFETNGRTATETLEFKNIRASKSYESIEESASMRVIGDSYPVVFEREGYVDDAILEDIDNIFEGTLGIDILNLELKLENFL